MYDLLASEYGWTKQYIGTLTQLQMRLFLTKIEQRREIMYSSPSPEQNSERTLLKGNAIDEYFR